MIGGLVDLSFAINIGTFIGKRSASPKYCVLVDYSDLNFARG